ncbi:adenosylcobinamide-phosphate synthase CbiB [Alkalilimnicola sp. S0819]|uniref:adenosylcobinamide-phosphate synthase CbiB n=1 Tax=Alkalilimnicola sp. S0819 TaxID=2613922 RepID=UPI001261C351|nr:adenosylcobinamide-phosphate synthase CbiB [Alkalilimnicola sp. S0819]KAB7623377.1 cobalamin biosynthesis protein [Alkalilimnicola sp. S0819]MPQ16918.1 cobalamin biosynthesis protein [Alkalilimnicola sp. S0819]
MNVIALLLAVVLDYWLGEPRRGHPLVAFGRLAQALERLCNRASGRYTARLFGLLAWLLAVLPATVLAATLSRLETWGPLCSVLLLYLCIGGASLAEHGRRVRDALQAGDLPAARAAAGLLVSRDSEALDATGAATATTESLLENGSDAVFGALFWFLVAGAPGVVAYRLANTLDAMWGYRTARYRHFGWAAARLDDLLNLLPARLTALSYALVGHTATALRCWRTQAAHWDSPNAGPVMAAGAGALGVSLGGPTRYHGVERERPRLGAGPTADADTITAALGLLQRSLWLWLALALVFLLVQLGVAHA